MNWYLDIVDEIILSCFLFIFICFFRGVCCVMYVYMQDNFFNFLKYISV